MKSKKDNSSEYMAKIGKVGGEKSRRVLSVDDARAAQKKSVITRMANKLAKEKEN